MEPRIGTLSIFWLSHEKKPATFSLAAEKAPVILSLMPPNAVFMLFHTSPALAFTVSQFLYSATPAATTAARPSTIQPIGVATNAAFSAHWAAVRAAVAPVATPDATALATMPALLTTIMAVLWIHAALATPKAAACCTSQTTPPTALCAISAALLAIIHAVLTLHSTALVISVAMLPTIQRNPPTALLAINAVVFAPTTTAERTQQYISVLFSATNSLSVLRNPLIVCIVVIAPATNASIFPTPHATASFFSVPISVSELSRTHCSASPAFCSARANCSSNCFCSELKSSPSIHCPNASAFRCTQSSIEPERMEPSSAAPASTHS